MKVNICTANLSLGALISIFSINAGSGGHTHDNMDYVANGTRVICNPRGYVTNTGAENFDFDPALVVCLSLYTLRGAKKFRARQDAKKVRSE